MRRRLRVAIERLARLLNQPKASGSHLLRSLGRSHVLYPDPSADPAPARRQTILVYQDQFLLLVDEFHGEKAETFALALPATKPLRRRGRIYLTRDSTGPLAIHPLGDYATDQDRGQVTFSQRLAHGRFLLALTRDPEARVRVLHGWAVEIRSQGRVHQVLHSNRSRKLRPLGPIQTDALFALADWPEQTEAYRIPAEVNLKVMQATQLVWGEERKVTAAAPVDLVSEPEA